MADDPFDLFDDNGDGPPPEKKYGLVLGERLSPEAFAAKFVNKAGTEGMPSVGFEVWDEATGQWVEVGDTK